MTTSTQAQTLADVLDRADPNQLADGLRKMGLGRMFSPCQITLAAVTADATIDLTSYVKGQAGVTIDMGLDDLATGEALPAAFLIQSIRVTASGTAASVGTYFPGDSAVTPLLPPGGASAAVGIASVSDSGAIITFPNTVTGVIIRYVPVSKTALTAEFAPAT